MPAGELSDDPGEWTRWGARRELRDLHAAGYLRAAAKSTPMGFSYPNTSVPEQRLGHQGLLVHDLLSLDQVDDRDVLAIHTALQLPGGGT